MDMCDPLPSLYTNRMDDFEREEALLDRGPLDADEVFGEQEGSLLANLRLDEEAYAAEMAAQQRDEIWAENAWLRHAEYDPEYAYERDQDRFDRYVYGD